MTQLIFLSILFFSWITGKNENCFGCLEFENGECLCIEFNSKAAKTYEEKRMNQARSIKATVLKKGFKNNILENDFEDVSLYEKPPRSTQK